jgi:uncharacterized protein (DUF1330 family)
MSVYWIANVEVHDLDTYKRYSAMATAPIQEQGGEFLVRGGEVEVLEGDWMPRTVVVRFPSREAALAAYHSPAYQAALELADASSTRRLVIADGLEG